MIKEKLTEAIEKSKQNDIYTYLWKYGKETVNGETVQNSKLLMDMDEAELQKCYQYCDTMLNNDDINNPGRYRVLNMIKEQRIKCNTELFIRWVESTEIPRFKFLEILRNVIDENKDKVENIYDQPISLLVSKCPKEFESIPIKYVLDGVLDKLGVMNRKHITMSFLTKQGIWLTPEESYDLTEKDEKGNIRDRLEVIKERLSLKPSIKLNLNSRGIKYKEFRAMVNLKLVKKYSELTTDQLTTLRDCILFRLEDDIRFHIDFWNQKEAEIRRVALAKGYNTI